MRRAGRLTGGSTAFFNGESSGNRLGIPAECRLACIEPFVLFVPAFDGTNFGAFAATRAFGWVHVPRLLQNLHGEISRLPGNLLNFRKGKKLDVEMPADLDQLGRDNSHCAFVSGEGFVQLGHASANC